jgi:hypothetical protein
MLIISVCVLSLIGACAAQLPAWTAPQPNATKPYAGYSLVQNTTTTCLYKATAAIGTYDHAAMIDYHNGMFTAVC